PLLHWALGIVGGGSSAATVQVATVLLRGGSTLTTGGAANPALAAGEIAAQSVKPLLKNAFKVQIVKALLKKVLV
ncbi:DUF4126 domain-containing protein, partial [Desulfobacula sp.]|uniref:DUF4126 domain-containing protein n=1 Tax=Desulfobacula sp. TaxID=2593537 RepID=UPI0039B8B965|nr:DUF4126 domain-containing protein [Desulfobacula sp.]